MALPSFLKNLAARLCILNERIHIDLEQKMRLATFYIGGAQEPSFFFPEITSDKEPGAFRKVSPKVLHSFIDEIVERSNFNVHFFEHLEVSFSVQTRYMKPYNVETLQTLRGL